jgi:hypothetical protein
MGNWNDQEGVTTSLITEVEVRFAGRVSVERGHAFEDFLYEVIDKALPGFFTPEEDPELFDSPRLHTREEHIFKGKDVRSRIENFGQGDWTS